MIKLVAGLICALFTSQLHAITKQQMVEHIQNVAEQITIDGNSINFTYRGIPETLVFDENADRMRLISPIIEVQKVDNGLLLNAMEANFHSVLDARYAVSNDLIWATFIHPLSDLSPSLFDSAISQVAIANASFGREFTSGTLFFPSTN